MKYKRLITVLLALSLSVTGNPFNFDTVSGASVSLDYKLGDINQDDSISVEDAQIVLLAYVQIMAGMESGLTEQQTKAADINADTAVSVEDAQYILIYYVANTLSGTEITWEQILHPEAAASTETTTSTKNITEPPERQGEEGLCIQGYYLEDICNDCRLFLPFSSRMYSDLMGDTNCIRFLDIGYGSTSFGSEVNFMFAALNYDYFGDDTIPYACYNFDDIDFSHSIFFLFNFRGTQERLQSDIDYSKYTVSQDVGDFLNDADQAYRNGTFDQFLNDTVYSNNVSSDVLDNPAAMAILYSYGQDTNFDNNYIDYNSIYFSLDNIAAYYADYLMTELPAY